MKINPLHTHFPNTFGEQAVQSALYSLAQKHADFEIVFFDPPGGAWTKFEMRDSSGELYRWDNIPKNPPKEFKRPDLILQQNAAQNIELLVFESKGGPTDEDSDIATMLEGFINHDPQESDDFRGIRNRPTHHVFQGGSWKPIVEPSKTVQQTLGFQTPTNPIKDRCWLSTATVNIETCYAFEITGGDVSDSLDLAADKYDVSLIIGIQFRKEEDSIQIYIRKTNDGSVIADKYATDLNKYGFVKVLED